MCTHIYIYIHIYICIYIKDPRHHGWLAHARASFVVGLLLGLVIGLLNKKYYLILNI